MSTLKNSMPFSALGVIFFTLGLVYSDPKFFSFAVVWFLIAAAKIILFSRSEKIKRSS
jgi:hypothetical protein